MTYDAAYFIAKFEGIPEERWCTNVFRSHGGRRCALGHCQESRTGRTDESIALANLLTDTAEINDGKDPRYQQPTPKQRVLAALKDLL